MLASETSNEQKWTQYFQQHGKDFKHYKLYHSNNVYEVFGTVEVSWGSTMLFNRIMNMLYFTSRPDGFAISLVRDVKEIVYSYYNQDTFKYKTCQEAVLAQDLNELKRMMEANCPPYEFIEGNGENTLCTAAVQVGNIDILKYLISMGCQLGYKKDMLSVVDQTKDADMLLYLLQIGCIDAYTNNLWDVIGKCGSIEVVQYLLQDDHRIQDECIYAAIEYGHFELLKWILTNGFKSWSCVPASKAAWFNRLDMLKWLHTSGYVATDGLSPYSWSYKICGKYISNSPAAHEGKNEDVIKYVMTHRLYHDGAKNTKEMIVNATPLTLRRIFEHCPDKTQFLQDMVEADFLHKMEKDLEDPFWRILFSYDLSKHPRIQQRMKQLKDILLERCVECRNILLDTTITKDVITAVILPYL